MENHAEPMRLPPVGCNRAKGDPNILPQVAQRLNEAVRRTATANLLHQSA
jgi:hypothetical protein